MECSLEMMRCGTAHTFPKEAYNFFTAWYSTIMLCTLLEKHNACQTVFWRSQITGSNQKNTLSCSGSCYGMLMVQSNTFYKMYRMYCTDSHVAYSLDKNTDSDTCRSLFLCIFDGTAHVLPSMSYPRIFTKQWLFLLAENAYTLLEILFNVSSNMVKNSIKKLPP